MATKNDGLRLTAGVFAVVMLLVIVSMALARACKWWYKIPLGERKALHLGR